MLSQEVKRQLYQQAFLLKNTWFWEVLAERQMFAVELSDGQTAYCSAMGQNGELVALFVLIGTTGFSSFYEACREITDADEYDSEDTIWQLLTILGEDGLRVRFELDGDVRPEEAREAKFFAKELGLVLRQPYPYPQFERLRPMRRPEAIEDEKDAIWLTEAMQACRYVTSLVRDGLLRLPSDFLSLGDVPLLTRMDSGEGDYSIRMTALPAPTVPEYPGPQPADEVTVARLKQCHREGTWDCAINFLLNTTVDDWNDPARIPAVTAIREMDSDMYLPVCATGDFIDDVDDVYRCFLESVIQLRQYPDRIRICRRDPRGRAFYSVFAKQLSIPLEEEDSLPELQEFMHREAVPSDEDQEQVDALVDMVCEFIRSMPVEELRDASPQFQILAQSVLSYEEMEIPEDVQQKIQECLKYWN